MIKRAIALSVLLVFLLSVGAGSLKAGALSEAQRDLFIKGINYFNIDLCDSSATPTDQGPSLNNKIYVIGDSLTEGMLEQGNLQAKLSNSGWSVTNIESTGGITIDSSIPKVKADARHDVSQAGTVLVGLGTNPTAKPAKSIDNMIDAIKTVSPDTKIDWINAYSTNDDYTALNRLLKQRESSGKIDKVLDWAQEASSHPTKYSLSSDPQGIHTNPAGYINRSEWVVSALGQPQAGAGPNQGSADTLSCCPPGGSTLLSGRNNAEKVWNFFIGKNFNNLQVAAIMGNLQQESGFSPTIINSSYGAYGLGQWLGGRKDALFNKANHDDLGVQLDFMWDELNGSYKDAVLKPLKLSSNLRDAVDIWLEHYEIPCSPGACGTELSIRTAFALAWKNKPLGGAGSNAAATTSVSGAESCNSPGDSQDANLQKTITVSTPGKFITLPKKYSCAGRETKIDSRIAADVAYLVNKYGLCADDGLASGHLSHGAGLAVDMRPRDGNSKDAWRSSAEAAARAIGWYGDGADDPKGSQPSCATYQANQTGSCMHAVEPDRFPKWLRWLGYNGAYNHGDPWHVYGTAYAHIHIGWDTPNNDGVSGTIISKPRESVYAFPAPVPDDLKKTC